MYFRISQLQLIFMLKIKGEQRLGRGRSMEQLLMGIRFPSEVMKIFWNYVVVIVAQLREYTTPHRLIHFKWVNFWYVNYI